MLIEDVTQAMRRARVRFAVAGGYAVALHGATRGTVDLDLVITLEKKQFVAAEKALRSLGLEPRLPVDATQVFEFREEYIANRNLLAWSFHHPQDPTRLVDILIAHDLRDMEIQRMRFGSIMLPVIGRDALIAMKKTAGRPQDLEDVRALESLK